MSAHARGVRIPRGNSWLLAFAFVVVAFASLVVAWMTRVEPSVPGHVERSNSAPAMTAPSRPALQPCLSCGTVLAIRTFELRGEAAERMARTRFVYRVTLQMDDGSYRTFSQSEPPPFPVGTKVRVLNGAIAPRT